MVEILIQRFSWLKDHLFLVLLQILMLGPVWTIAQEAPAPWGKVPTRDLTPVPDIGFDALVLFDVGYLTIKPGQGIHVLARHRRVKILKKEGFERAKISLPVYSQLETIRQLKAQMILPTGEVVPLGKKDFSQEKVNDYLSTISFSFPDLVEGAIIEYRYEKNSSLIEELPSWYFQEDIPVRWSEYILEIPDWYQYRELMQGEAPFINDSKVSRKGFSLNGISSILQRRIVYREVPAMEPASFITTMDDYRAGVRFFLESIGPEGARAKLFTDWKAAARDLGKAEDFGLQYTEARKYRRALAILPELIDSEMSAWAKVDTIYSFLAQNFKWDESFGIYTNSDLNNSFDKKRGSKAELNLMLIALLREAGIPSWPILVRSRERGKPIQEFPLLDQFDYPIALANSDGQFLFLDLGDPYLPMGYPAIEVLNDSGFLADTRLAQWVGLKAPPSRIAIMADVQLDTSGTLAGTIENSYEGYETYFLRQEMGQKTSQAYSSDWLQDYYSSGVVNSASLTRVEGDPSKMTMKLDCELPKAINTSDSLVYLFPVLFPIWDENPLKTPTRSFPVDFPYAFKEEHYLKLQLPSQFEVMELPEPIDIELPNGGGKLNYYVIEKGEQQLQMVFRLQLDQTQFTSDEYPELKSFLDRLMEKQESRIVLRKVN